MKHYIYLTEDKLYYIRKENRARGYSFMGSRTITGPETVTGVDYRITCNNGNQRTLINP